MRMTKVPRVKEYIIPEGVKTIPAYAFNYNDTIEKVIIPNTVTKIADYAFRECVNLKEIIIPDSVVEMGNSVFHRCGHLEKVVLPSHWIYIPDSTFFMCTRLVDVSLPKNLTTIESSAFCKCTHIEKIDLPSSVDTIKEYAFASCLALSEINIPQHITEIQAGAFAGCRNLNTPILHGNGEKTYTWVPDKYPDFVYYNNVFLHCPHRTHGVVSIKEGTTRIEDYSFSKCPWITEIVLPTSIKSIGENVFEGCTRLKSIKVLDHVVSFQSESSFWKEELKKYIELEVEDNPDDIIELENLFDLPDEY